MQAKVKCALAAGLAGALFVGAPLGAGLAGFFLASAGAHPGGGLTGLPGMLAARAVLERWRARR